MGNPAGDWGAAGKRDAARPSTGDDEEDGDAFGDFEDLETGQLLLLLHFCTGTFAKVAAMLWT